MTFENPMTDPSTRHMIAEILWRVRRESVKWFYVSALLASRKYQHIFGIFVGLICVCGTTNVRNLSGLSTQASCSRKRVFLNMERIVVYQATNGLCHKTLNL